jgi:hypothetical protein
MVVTPGASDPQPAIREILGFLTATGRLTEPMLDAVFRRVRALVRG